MFFRKKTSSAPPTPPWIKWLVLAFLLFAVLGNWHTEKTGGPRLGAFQKAKTDAARLMDFSAYKRAIFPEYDAELRFNDQKEGKGAPVLCGQEVTISYDSFLMNNTKLPDSVGKDKPLTFRTGSGEAMPAFERGVLGMRIGGMRSLLAPASMAYDAPGHTRADVPSDAPVRFEVELMEATPPAPDMKNIPFRSSNVMTGRGMPLGCGQEVHVNVTVWSVEGKKLFSTEDGSGPVTFTTGKSEVFLGLEQGVIGMGLEGKRTLIVPPALLKTLTGAKPAVDFPFPKNQTVLVDVTALP